MLKKGVGDRVFVYSPQSQLFRIEELIGWVKTVGGMRRTRFKGMRRTQQGIEMVAASYNLLRIARLSVV